MKAYESGGIADGHLHAAQAFLRQLAGYLQSHHCIAHWTSSLVDYLILRLEFLALIMPLTTHYFRNYLNVG